jgi:serine protease Do
MINMIHKHKPGDEVKIKFKRDGKEMELSAKLEKRPAAMLGNPQEFMGSTLSNRRGGFPRILQHDTVIKPVDCGGPLVDLDSKAVGINIARAGRTESYAIPSEVVRDLIPELMSGRLAPPPEDEPVPPKKEEK